MRMRCMQNVMDDFVCALQKRILLQGRLYVFEHYVCFHANVFGYVKKIIIPLKVHGACGPHFPVTCLKYTRILCQPGLQQPRAADSQPSAGNPAMKRDRGRGLCSSLSLKP